MSEGVDIVIEALIARLGALPVDAEGAHIIRQAIGLLTLQERQLAKFSGFTPNQFTYWRAYDKKRNAELLAQKKRIQELEDRLSRIFQFTDELRKPNGKSR